MQGLCSEPRWSGTYSCPVAGASLWNYDCLPGDTHAACGSSCLNSCGTECRDFRAPLYTITMYSDSNCTQQTNQPARNLTRSCLPLSNGGSVGWIKFDNNGFQELVSCTCC